MDQASEAILALKPVTFRYKSDNTATPQFGLIAEDVAAVNPDLVVHDEKGENYTVRYEAVNAMLLNEFLKEHRKLEQQERKIQEQDYKVREQGATISAMKSTVAQQQKGMEVLTAQLRQQAAQIQRVSAQLEASQPALQVVNNNQ
jgi:septal ring factor EnvC (AmiA/AmiB activator)